MLRNAIAIVTTTQHPASSGVTVQKTGFTHNTKPGVTPPAAKKSEQRMEVPLAHVVRTKRALHCLLREMRFSRHV